MTPQEELARDPGDPQREALASEESKFKPLLGSAFGSTIQQVIMPLFKKDGEQFVSIGTGFMVSGNGLMMTAAHSVNRQWVYSIGRKREAH